jgi:hypothetical protein
MEFIQTVTSLPGRTVDQRNMIKMRVEKIPEIRIDIDKFAGFVRDYVSFLYSDHQKVID